MPPRQRMGFPGGMYGRNPQQPGMFPGQMMGVPPMMGGMPQGPQKRGGGLLSKLLGNNRGPQAPVNNRAAGGGGATGASLLKSLGNPSTINGFLTNTQQVIKTAQTIGPMVQQYGPLVKNIPAMWKLYRGLKNSSETEAPKAKEEVKENEKVDAPVLKDPSLSVIPVETDQHIEKHIPPIMKNPGESKPKMYI